MTGREDDPKACASQSAEYTDAVKRGDYSTALQAQCGGCPTCEPEGKQQAHPGCIGPDCPGCRPEHGLPLRECPGITGHHVESGIHDGFCVFCGADGVDFEGHPGARDASRRPEQHEQSSRVLGITTGALDALIDERDELRAILMDVRSAGLLINHTNDTGLQRTAKRRAQEATRDR